MSETRFVSDNFQLDTQANYYQLDHIVAARIADVLFFSDETTKKSVGYRDLNFVVDPTGQTLTEPNKFSGKITLQDRISFSASLSSDVNQTFARHMQAVLLERERRNNFPLRWSLACTALTVGTPAASMVGLAETTSGPGALMTDVLFIGGLASILGTSIWKADAKQYLRRNVVRPGSLLYRRKLAAAEKVIGGLKLPPVVSTYN